MQNWIRNWYWQTHETRFESRWTLAIGWFELWWALWRRLGFGLSSGRGRRQPLRRAAAAVFTRASSPSKRVLYSFFLILTVRVLLRLTLSTFSITHFTCTINSLSKTLWVFQVIVRVPIHRKPYNSVALEFWFSMKQPLLWILKPMQSFSASFVENSGIVRCWQLHIVSRQFLILTGIWNFEFSIRQVLFSINLEQS